MEIVTPAEIESVAWEGELVAPEMYRSAGPASGPLATIGRPEVWPAAEVLRGDGGQEWVPPMGNASFWLVRLACTLHEPGGRLRITEAQQNLELVPNPEDLGEAYAFSLFPERLAVEDSAVFNISLGPELSFGDATVKVGEIGATINYRKVFPVIQSYGAGESNPSWIFKPHARHPIGGSQFVYAVVVSRESPQGIRGSVELVVTAETHLGPLRYGTPREATADTSFTIP